MFTPRFDRYVAPARRYNQIWRIFLGVATISGIYFVWFLGFLGVLNLLLGQQYAAQIIAQIGEGTNWIGVLLVFPTFGGLALGAVIAAKLFHKRSFGSLIGPRHRVLSDFATAAVTVLAIYAGLLVVWSVWFTPVPGLELLLWLKLLPIAILGILLQTGAEELVFRGYLQQQLAARFRTPIIWMVVPSLTFAALHYDPGINGENTWIILGATALFGLLAADLTRITGSLGAAWGFHFANNLFAILLIAIDGSLSGLSIYVTPYRADDTSLLPMLIAGDLVAMGIAWLYLRHRLKG